MSFLTKKSFESVSTVDKNSKLAKTLNGFDLVLLGLGAIIGTGVFVFTGLVAATEAGPAVILSYILAGLTCIFVAFAYTELAVMLPSSGSIYTYAYVAFGELAAWMMAGVLIVELTFAGATVATSWSRIIQEILALKDIHLPYALSVGPSEGGVINLLAVIALLFVGFMLYRGTKDSKKLNAVLVGIKLVAITAFLLSAIPHFDTKHWDDFFPFGVDGAIRGSAVLFFAFNGFSGLAAAAEECKNPKKDLTVGIIGSLLLSTVIYVLVAGLLTGIISYKEVNSATSLAHALSVNGSNIGSVIVNVGAIAGITTVMLITLYVQTRILFAIARDGLLPKSLTTLHKKHGSPYRIVVLVIAIASTLAGFVPLKVLGSIISMGTLIDYTIVLVIVMLFRFTYPHKERIFKSPALFLLAPIGLFGCVYLLSTQFFNTDWSVSDAGQVLLLWFSFVFVGYLVRKVFGESVSASSLQK